MPSLETGLAPLKPFSVSLFDINYQTVWFEKIRKSLTSGITEVRSKKIQKTVVSLRINVSTSCESL